MATTMHAYAVAEGRLAKAQKVDRVVSDFLGCEHVAGLKILDVGCGSGHFAHFFAERNTVTGVDVVDQRSEECKASFAFQQVSSERLPFPEDSFDLVLSNQVATYLADAALHFGELARVLRPGGLAYVAVPNRAFPIEPHHLLPLVGYLPQPMYMGVLKLLGKYQTEIHLPWYRQSKRRLTQAGFTVRDYTARILREPRRFGLRGPALPGLPDFSAALSPTNIFVAQKR